MRATDLVLAHILKLYIIVITYAAFTAHTMKTTALTAVLALAMVGTQALAQDECNLTQETLDKIDYASIATACEYIGGDQSFDTCDACLGSLLGNLLLPLYPSLGLDVSTFPASPTELATALASGEDVGLTSISDGGPCSEFLTNEADAADADVQAYFFSIIGCDSSVGWGPKVIDAVTQYYPGFVAAPPS